MVTPLGKAFSFNARDRGFGILTFFFFWCRLVGKELIKHIITYRTILHIAVKPDCEAITPGSIAGIEVYTRIPSPVL